LILCIDREGLEYFNNLMKKNMLKKPKFMERNIIILNNIDFSELVAGEYYQAVELFKLVYILDDKTIDKIKII
jgi:hypothetical protein